MITLIERIRIKSDDMREDFRRIKEQLPGICKIASDFYLVPKKRGSHYFIKSPVSHDKTWSLALYPASDTFCDFANGNRSGDSVSLVSYLKGVNNWQALQTLKDFYGLEDAREQDKQELQRRIQLQQERERKKRQWQQAFKTVLFRQIDSLRLWEDFYTFALENCLYEPLNDMWCYIMDELQRTEYRLDILCGTNQSGYRSMKYSDCVPSDYPQWLLDSLAILLEAGVFQATREEIGQIITQRDYELTKKPGGVSRCEIEW